jgi:hypothetical protein
MKTSMAKFQSEIINDNLRIKIIFPKKKNKLLANATVCVNTVDYNFFIIKGFQIWPSPIMNGRLQEYINITPPSVQMYGKYIPFVFIENPKKWEELERYIYSAYLKAIQEKSKTNNEEKIKPEDIPF